jgi:uncharacterized membrane protein YciS (DUF1049 family)
MTESWNLLYYFSYFATAIPIIEWIVIAIINIAFAVAVLADTKRSQTFLVKGWVWALATLLGGLFVVGIYWVIHHSSIRSQD